MLAGGRFGYVGLWRGTVRGYSIAGILKAPERYHIYSLYVLPEYQGRGLGKALLECSYRQARALHFRQVWLGVMEENRPAVEWYTRQGFYFVEREPFTFGQTTVQALIGYRELS
jgi:ribosomal protein S18 acetylase RimI-like enzyme